MSTTADPVLDALERLNSRLDRLEQKVDSLGYLAHLGGRLPTIADAAGTGADFVWKSAEDAGIDPIHAGQRSIRIAMKAADDSSLDLVEKLLAPDSLALVGKLVEPDTLALAGKLVEPDTLALAGKLVEPDTLALAHKLIARTELLDLAVNMGDALVGELKTQNVDLDQLAKGSAKVAASVAGSLDVAAKGSTALVEAKSSPAESVGPFGMFFKLMDADVQRAVGFTMALAKKFGAALKS